MSLAEKESDFTGVNGHIGYLLRQAQHAIHLKIEQALARFDVTHSQFAVMSILQHRTDLHSADIAKFSMFSPQATNKVIERLERMSLIIKTSHATNKRILVINLTKKGNTLVQKCQDKVNLIEQDLVKSLTKHNEKIIRQWLVDCLS